MNMKGFLTKLISSTTALLAVSSTSYAQQKASMPQSGSCCFEQGYELCNNKYPAAYNAPARIDVQCSWDFFATASFLYWHVDQEAMDLAYAYPTASSSDHEPNGGNALVQSFSYNPGFKVGLGADFEHDNWVGFVEYTWYHQQTTTGKHVADSDYSYNTSTWFDETVFGALASEISSKWRVNLDMIDATLSRPFYQGRKLTVVPFGGLRGAWVRQNMRVTATTSTGYPQVSHNNSHSWSVGPRAGMQVHWLVGCGFRVEGDVGGSLLFTRYTSVGHRDTDLAATYDALLGYSDYNTVTPTADMGIGLGWGSYFDRQNYHFDLVATYDFNVFFGQNMMRQLANVVNGYSQCAPGDLHLHGLTLTARFDF
jgi:hypothetical protein